MSSNAIRTKIEEVKSFRLPDIDAHKENRMQAIQKRLIEALKVSDEFKQSAELYGICRSYATIDRIKEAQKIVPLIPFPVFKVLATKCISDSHLAKGDLLKARRSSDSIIETSIGREASCDVDQALEIRRDSLERASQQRRKFT